MRIAVCVKWVPAISRLRFDTETKRIVREGVPNEINPHDVLAMNRALDLRRQHGGNVTAFTMGPPDARRALARCLAMGVDAVYHLNDIAFAGSDTLATARALSLALARERFDLILFGNSSVDAETGQVGPEVAEMLDLPQITGVYKFDLSGTTVHAERVLENGIEVVEASTPLVVCVGEGIASDVGPSREDIRAAEERDIPQLTAADLTDNPSLFGQSGSPTWVSEIKQLESVRAGERFEGGPAEQMAKDVVSILVQRGALSISQDVGSHSIAASTIRPCSGPETWVVMETDRSDIRRVSFELLAAAQGIADAVSGPVVALLIGGDGATTTHTTVIGQAGADIVRTIIDERLEDYSTAAYASVLAQAIQQKHPYAVLVPATPNGRDLASRVAARLQLGLTGDCIGLEVDSQGRLVQLKPAFGGNIVAPIYSSTLPNMTTVRPGMFEPLTPNTERNAPVLRVPVEMLPSDAVRTIEFRPSPDDDSSILDTATAVICIGMGVGVAGQIGALDDLRNTIDAEYGCTRDVVDVGWMPRQRQIGLTGRSVAPRLYVAIGVRGDFNHTVAIQRSGTVVAINNDRRASFFRGQSDVGVVADWREFVPALVAELRRAVAQDHL